MAGLVERSARRRSDLLPVLTYHRVLPAAAMHVACPSTTSTTTDQFATQMRFIARTRRAVGVDELLRVQRGEHELAPASILLTFDDGYADFGAYVWPILRDLRLPAILFVPTGHVGADGPAFWWDRLWLALLQTNRQTTPTLPVGALPLGTRALAEVAFRALRRCLKSLPHTDLMLTVDDMVDALGQPSDLPATLDWAELRVLHREGLTIASHSVSHPLLTRVTRARRGIELRSSLTELDREIGPTPPVFAYPAGALDDDVVVDTSEAGYEIAFTTDRGVNDVTAADWLRLKRINVGARAPNAAVRAQLAPRIAELARVLE